MATKLEVTEFDFDDIKTNLKIFMKNQSTFTDYDFEGSGMANLIDLLAYNTHYLVYNMNMLANEMFIDSAVLRSSVTSHAKTLSYEPTSATCSTALINVTLNTTQGSATIDSSTNIFTGNIGLDTHQFNLLEDITSTSSGNYIEFTNLKVYDGTKVVTNYTVDSTNVDQKFLLTDNRADTSTLKVEVFNDASSTISQAYTKVTDITQVTSSSTVYFLQEVSGAKFEVYFGDGVIGNKLSDGNIVKLTYIITNKSDADGVNTFTSATAIDGVTDIIVTTVSASSGGAEPESVVSIKQNAPLDYASQGRAVTTEDYKIYARKLFPNTKSVTVWGGEDGSYDSSLGVVDTASYGRVYISIKSTTGNNLTATEKLTLETALAKYKVASITPVVVDPETMYIIISSFVKFDSTKTTKTFAELEIDIINTLKSYNTNKLLEFGNIFRHSEVTGLIDDTHSSILNNITNIAIVKYLTPVTTSSTAYNVYFRNKFYNPHAGHNSTAGGVVASTGFKISGDTTTVYYFDEDGNGNLRRYSFSSGVRVYADSLAGIVNYTTGAININKIQISSIEDVDGVTSAQIRFVVTPDSKDIAPVRNQLLELDFVNSAVTVDVDTVAIGSSSTSTYNTTSSHTTTTAY